MKNFEEWIGQEILERGRNSVSIPPALRENENEIRALIERVQQLRTLIQNFDPEKKAASIACHHAPIHSIFPELAVQAKRLFPTLKLTLKAGDLDDCVSIFLRGDSDMLLCYEGETAPPLPFGSAVDCTICGQDQLIPVLGGTLRAQVRSDGSTSSRLPAITYPTSSAFGRMLQDHKMPFGTAAFSKNVACETAFSNGVKDLVLGGLGIGWLPASMGYRELERGDLISLAGQYGRVPLRIALYSNKSHAMAVQLAEVWGHQLQGP